MKFSTPVFLLSVLSLVSAQTTADSSGSRAILAIDAAVRNFTAVLTAYNGGINQAGPVMLSILNIHAVNRAGFDAVSASAPYNLAQSQRIVTVTSTTVGTSIPAAIALTEAKKPLFDQAQLSSLIEAELSLLQYDHDTFSLAVGAKLDPTTTVGAAAAAGAIAASIAGGMAYYAV